MPGPKHAHRCSKCKAAAQLHLSIGSTVLVSSHTACSLIISACLLTCSLLPITTWNRHRLLCVQSTCMQVSYCSQHCQQKHWESHQHQCLAPRATLRPAAASRSHLATLSGPPMRGRPADSSGCCDPFAPRHARSARCSSGIETMGSNGGKELQAGHLNALGGMHCCLGLSSAP